MKISLREALKRFLFLALIATLGFGIERMYQGSRDSGGDHAENHVRIVVIGGSIAMGTAPKLQYHLRRITGRDDIDVIDSAIRMANAQVATSLVDDAIANFHPHAILLMLGLQEDEVETSDRTTPLADAVIHKDAIRAAREFDDLLSRQQYPAAVSALFQFLDVLAHPPFAKPFSDVIRKYVAEKAKTPSPDAWTRNEFLALNVWLMWLRPGRPTEPGNVLKPDVLAKRLPIKIQDLVSKTRDWPQQIRGKTFEAFVAEGHDDEDKLTRGWFWATWALHPEKNERVANSIDFFASDPWHLTCLFPVLSFLKNNHEIAARFATAEPHAIYDSVIHAKSEGFWPIFGGVNRNRLTPAAAYETWKSSQSKRLSELIATIRSSGAQPVLLHYPALRIPFIDDVAKDSNVIAIGNEHLFEDLIAENGRELYFLDETRGTGHLTDAGFEVYCKFVAEKLAPVLVTGK